MSDEMVLLHLISAVALEMFDIAYHLTLAPKIQSSNHDRFRT